MASTDTMLEISGVNQDLFVDLNEKEAQTVSGGCIGPSCNDQRFAISNQTNLRISYSVNGKMTSNPNGGSESTWTVSGGAEISFDSDFGKAGEQLKKYNLSDGRKYAFKLNEDTSYAYDIELFAVGYVKGLSSI